MEIRMKKLKNNFQKPKHRGNSESSGYEENRIRLNMHRPMMPHYQRAITVN